MRTNHRIMILLFIGKKEDNLNKLIRKVTYSKFLNCERYSEEETTPVKYSSMV